MQDASRTDRLPRPAGWAVTLLATACCIGGCANTHWERAVYEGLRRSPNTGERASNPAPAPDAALPEYARYEQERERLRSGR